MRLHDVLALKIYAGGPGSGCHGPNCGRPAGTGQPITDYGEVQKWAMDGLKDIRGRETPEDLYVFRLQEQGSDKLAGRDAADLLGVANFINYTNEELISTGDTVVMYRVHNPGGSFGEYERARGGGVKRAGIGRDVKAPGTDWESHWYSFGSGDWKATKLGEVNVRDLDAFSDKHFPEFPAAWEQASAAVAIYELLAKPALSRLQ